MTNQELIQEAAVIRDERNQYANTAERVGTALVHMAEQIAAQAADVDKIEADVRGTLTLAQLDNPFGFTTVAQWMQGLRGDQSYTFRLVEPTTGRCIGHVWLFNDADNPSNSNLAARTLEVVMCCATINADTGALTYNAINGSPRIYYRSYCAPLNGGTPDGGFLGNGWSPWQEYRDYVAKPIKEALAALQETLNSVDDEPTAGSDNLVKSGGVVSFINNFTGSGLVYHGTENESFPLSGNVGDVFEFTISNLSSADGYLDIRIDTNVYMYNVLVKSGETISNSITLSFEPHSVEIRNLNSRDIICVLTNRSQSNNNISKDARAALNLLNNYVLEPQALSRSNNFDVELKANKKYYLKITNSSDSDGYFAAKVYDQIDGNALFAKSNFLINAGQTVVTPLSLGQEGTYISITNVNAREAEYSIYFIDENEKVSKALLNEEVPYVISEFSTSTSQNFSLSVIDDVLTATKSVSESSCRIDFRKKSTPVSAGDFVFVKMKIKSTISEWVKVATYSTGTDQKADYFFLEANVERVIAFRGSNVATTGTLNLMIEQPPALNLATSVITITNLEVYVNGYTDIKLPNLDYSENNRTFIVDRNGGGHFYSISNAVNYVKNSFDVKNNSYAVFVKNGVYDKEKNDLIDGDYPYAVINKGSNRISIIGESRDNTIIRWTNNAVCEYKIIEVGSSPCIIGNLSLENLKGEDYIEAKGHNPYCLHIDLGGDLDTFGAYKTEVYNCRLYDECHAPIGAGLTKNQTIHVHDCVLVTNSKMGKVFDTLYIHGNASGQSTYDDTMAVEIENNILVNKTGGKALTLPDTGQSTFRAIPCIIIGNLLYSSDMENIIDRDAATRYNKAPYCMGNNIQELNK